MSELLTRLEMLERRQTIASAAVQAPAIVDNTDHTDSNNAAEISTPHKSEPTGHEDMASPFHEALDLAVASIDALADRIAAEADERLSRLESTLAEVVGITSHSPVYRNNLRRRRQTKQQNHPSSARYGEKASCSGSEVLQIPSWACAPKPR
jgi:hypothetical protein